MVRPSTDEQWSGWTWDANLYWHNEWDRSTNKQYCIMFMLTKDWTVLTTRSSYIQAQLLALIGPSLDCGTPPYPGLRISHGCCDYLILTFWTDPHAFRNGFQGWIQAVQVINTRTRVAHEQLATASAHSAEILMDVSLWGRIGPISFPAQLSPTGRLWRGGGGTVIWFTTGLVLMSNGHVC